MRTAGLPATPTVSSTTRRVRTLALPSPPSRRHPPVATLAPSPSRRHPPVATPQVADERRADLEAAAALLGIGAAGLEQRLTSRTVPL